MEELISREFDNEFKKISGLNLFPWVGKEYQESNRRILIVGESHYLNEDNPDDSGSEMTRNCIYECPVNEEWYNKTYMTINKVLCSDRLINNELLWQKIAYYNFIPRIMNTNDERPTDDEFISSWKLFLKVIELIKPTDCIFMGIKAANYYNNAMEKFQINYSPVDMIDKVGKVYPRSVNLLISGYNLRLNFIQHPSRIMNYNIWSQFLKENAKEAINFIDETVLQEQSV